MSLPCLPTSCSCLVVSVTFVETSALFAGGSKSASFAVFVDWFDDPVDSGIAADGLVLRINQNDFVVLVCAVLVDPIAVQDTKVGATAADTLLSCRLERSLVLELIHTLVCWLA